MTVERKNIQFLNRKAVVKKKKDKSLHPGQTANQEKSQEVPFFRVMM